MTNGADYGDTSPRSPLSFSFAPVSFLPNYLGVLTVAGRQFLADTYNQFREGQSVLVTLELGLETPGVSRVRLMPWWLKSNSEFRPPGASAATYTAQDVAAFGAFGATLGTTEGVWVPGSHRRIVLPPVSPVSLVYERYHRVVWEFEMPVAGPAPGFRLRHSFFVPAQGRGLGFTSEFDGTPGMGPMPIPVVYLAWKTGVAGQSIEDVLV